MTPEPRPDYVLKGRHVLLGLIAFFGVMVLVNAVFVYFAVATFSGGDASNTYSKGLHYNETLEAARLQEERGWRTELAYDDKSGRLTFKVLDRAAEPINGLHVAAALERPATDKEDRKVVLKALGEGAYAATIDLAPGAWVVGITSRREGEDRDDPYRLKQRLVVAETP
ncbi:MAG: FixH family protein [Methyloceanibacter sp.]